jgi:hypothetical protein
MSSSALAWGPVTKKFCVQDFATLCEIMKNEAALHGDEYWVSVFTVWGRLISFSVEQEQEQQLIDKKAKLLLCLTN